MNCTTGFHDDYDDDDYWRQTRKFFWGGITKWIDLKSKVVYLKILGGLVVIKSPLIFWQPLRLRNEDEAKCLTGRTGKAGLRSRQVKSEISSSHWNVCGARLIGCTVERRQVERSGADCPLPTQGPGHIFTFLGNLEKLASLTGGGSWTWRRFKDKVWYFCQWASSCFQKWFSRSLSFSLISQSPSFSLTHTDTHACTDSLFMCVSVCVRWL